MIEEDVLPRELTSPIARRGKWTAEEERYTEKIIFDFEHGTLDVPEGTTLRTLLSKVLNCDPMRITKKYTGNSSIGKRTFVPLVRSAENAIFMDMSQQDLRELRAVWVNKLILMEQWNNRKMNLMKAHMGLGGPYDANGPNPHGRFDPPGAGSMPHGSTPQGSLMLHRQSSGSGEYPEHMLNELNGALDSSMENFQEVSLRLILEPYVAAPSEMDYIIKWLKTLNYVLVNRTLSPADLEHSLFARSISLPALVAIYRSGCVAEHARLQQVHETIETYLRQIGITFPVPESTKSVNADAPSKSTAFIVSTTTSATTTSAGAAASGAAEVKSKTSESSTSASGSASGSASPDKTSSTTTAEDAKVVLPSLPPVAPPSSTDSLPTGKEEKAESAGTGTTHLLLSAAEPSVATTSATTSSTATEAPERSTAAAAAVSVAGSMLPIIPEHLQHHFAPSLKSPPHKGIPASTTASSTSNTAEVEKKVSSVFGSKYSLLPYAPEPGSEALYQAEQQALAFAEQQARAHAAAQAQAQALAESYQYPRSKLDPSRVSELAAQNPNAATSSTNNEGSSNEEPDDHLMQYHKALVQSLAAERNLKKSAAAAAKSHSAALVSNLNASNLSALSMSSMGMGGGGGMSGSGLGGVGSNTMGGAGGVGSKTARPVPGPGPPHLTGPSQPQKRRKLAEYTDMYMRAAYPQQFAPVGYHPSRMGAGMGAAIGGGMYDGSFGEHQMQALANAAGEDSAHMYPNTNSHSAHPGHPGAHTMYGKMSAMPRYGEYGAVQQGMQGLQGMYPRMPGGYPVMDQSQLYSSMMRSGGAGGGGVGSGSGGAGGASGASGNSGSGGGLEGAEALTQAFEATQRRTTATATGSTNTNPTANTSSAINAGNPMMPPYMAHNAQFPPELLALYMQQMYGGWPYGTHPSHPTHPHAAHPTHSAHAAHPAHPSHGGHMQQQAHMMHFAESLHSAALANSSRQSAEAYLQHQKSGSTGASNGNGGSTNTVTPTSAASTDLANKLTLDEYLKTMQRNPYPYPTSTIPATPDANHMMMMAALNDPRYMYGDSSVYRDPAYGMQYMMNGGASASVSGAGTGSTNGAYGMPTKPSANASSNTTANNNAGNTSANGTNTTGANSAGSGASEGDSEGKEKGHSAAAEALLTLLKK